MSDIVTETLLSEKLEKGYDRNTKVNNFCTDNELLVTITLDEYRNLVGESATKARDIKEANDGKWERINEIAELKKKVEELDAQLFEYRKIYGKLEDVKKESEDSNG